MRLRKQGIAQIMTPAMLIGSVLALVAAIWAVLPDAYLKQGMYRLAAQQTLPMFNLAAVVLAGLGLLLIIRRFTHATASVLTILILGGYFFNSAALPRLFPGARFLGNLIIVLFALLTWLFLRRLAASGNLLPSRALSRVLSVAVLAAFCLLQLFAHGLPPFSPPPGPNLVLVGVDTLRATNLGCYGYSRDTSPNIDRWAAGAVLFEQCITSTPRTTQSMVSLLTSRYPVDTGVRYLTDRMPREQLSLAEVLKNHGYTTIAVIATGIPHQRLEDGFDVVIDTTDEWKADETLTRTLDQLARVKKKYFLFVFFRDPHMPYEPSKLEFDQDYQGRFRLRGHYHPDKKTCVFNNGLTPAERAHFTALYDSEIRDVDRAFSSLLEAVEGRGGENLIVFWSDHGESLGEHDYYYDHGDLLYQPGLRVPLIISGIPFDRQRISQLVRTIDLAPTLLGHLGIELRNSPFQGVDLRQGIPDLPAFSESGHAMIRTAYSTGRRFLPGLHGRLRSLTMGSRKLICIPRKGGYDFEYYDLARDQKEVSDLAKTGAEYREMKKRLLHWVEQDRPNWTNRAKVYDKETREQLRSLGYLD